MKNYFLILLSLGTMCGYCEHITIDNQTQFPDAEHKSKIAVQWADNFNDLQKSNLNVIYGDALQKIEPLKSGVTDLSIPENGSYFRIVVWSGKEDEPDLLTNWIDIDPSRKYTVTDDVLTPAVLILGSGC